MSKAEECASLDATQNSSHLRSTIFLANLLEKKRTLPLRQNLIEKLKEKFNK